MEMLDDYSLLIVFKMLHPSDWLNVSRVCRRWNALSISLWDSKLCLSVKSNSVQKISYKLGVLIIKNVAPGIRHFESSFDNTGGRKLKIQLGTFEFYVRGLTEGQIIKILSAYAYKITSMDFTLKNHSDDYFRTKYFKQLVRSNCELKVLKLGFNSSLIVKEVRSSLEELSLACIFTMNFFFRKKPDKWSSIMNKIDFKVLKRICSELKTLKLAIFGNSNQEVNEIMNSVALCVPKVVDLAVILHFNFKEPCQMYDFVPKLIQLQNFSSDTNKIVNVPYKVINEITGKCREIKSFELQNSMITVKSFAALLSLPNLAELSLADVVDMPLVTGTLSSLSELYITFSKTKNHQKTIKWEKLLESIKMMPKLQFLRVLNVPEEIRFRLVTEVISSSIQRGFNPVVLETEGNNCLFIKEFETDKALRKSVSYLRSMVMSIMIDYQAGFMNRLVDYAKENFAGTKLRIDSSNGK